MPIPRTRKSSLPLSPDNGVEETAIVAAKQGSADAIAVLYRRYERPLLRMVRLLTGSQHDAEDVVHDLFLGLPESLRGYEHRGHLHSWLRVTAVRIAMMKMRAARRHNLLIREESEGMRVAAPETDPWNSADLEAAIGKLPESLRAVFILRQLEDRTHDEIAEILGLTSGAVRVRYARAVARLREMLEYGE